MSKAFTAFFALILAGWSLTYVAQVNGQATRLANNAITQNAEDNAKRTATRLDREANELAIAIAELGN